MSEWHDPYFDNPQNVARQRIYEEFDICEVNNHNLADEILRLRQENASLSGHILRLEKSNQELGEENHRLKGQGTGWNAT